MNERAHNSDLVLIGRVISVNFPKRQIRVLSETDHPERFLDMRQITLETADGRLEKFDIERVELLEKKALITLGSRHDSAELAAVKKALVVVRKEERYPLDEDEHYVDDLIGMQVVDASGRVLGRLSAVYKTGANDVYEILDRRSRSFMVPAVQQRILNVDVANGVITLDPEGLIDSSDEN